MTPAASTRDEMIPDCIEDVKQLMIMTGGRFREWTRSEIEATAAVYEAEGLTLPDDVADLLTDGAPLPDPAALIKVNGEDTTEETRGDDSLLSDAIGMVRAGGPGGVADILTESRPDLSADTIHSAVSDAVAIVGVEKLAAISVQVGEMSKPSERTVRYIVNNARVGIARQFLTTVLDRDGNKTSERKGQDVLFGYYLEAATVHINPIDPADDRYTLLFRDTARRDLTLLYEEEPLRAIIDDLPNRPGVTARRLLPEAVTTILHELRRKDRMAVERCAPATGFFEDETGAIYFSQSKRFEIGLPEYSRRYTRDALLFLDTIVNFYAIGGDTSVPEHRDHILIGLYFYAQAHLGTIRKGRGRENHILLLAGESHVGKTWLEKIGAGMWGIPQVQGIVGASKLSIPQIAEHLDRTTLPIALDEVRKLLSDPAMADLLKSTTTGMLIKERIRSHENFRRQKFMAYASIVMSANYVPDLYLGLAERLIPVTFTARNKRDPETFKRFETDFATTRDLLPHIGSGIRELCRSEWPRIRDAATQDDQIEAGRQILGELYRFVGLDRPEWLQPVETKYAVAEYNPVEEVCKFLAEDFLKRLQMSVPRGDIGIDWEIRLETMRAHGLVPTYLNRISNDNIGLTKDVLTAMEKKGTEIAGGLIGLMDRIQNHPLQRKKQSAPASDKGRRTVYLDRDVFISYVETGYTDDDDEAGSV